MPPAHLADPSPGSAAGSLSGTVDVPGLEAHPHARAVLTPALPPKGTPSHAYLFHGPPGTGRSAAARAFAAALLADRAPDPITVAERVSRGAHPDLTWVRPSGANEMLVSDIDQAVVAAAASTPFESHRRVFVIEGAHQMNDQVANRLLKTLEEPPPFVHLILLAHRLQDVLPTVASRCLHVRFDPQPLARIEQQLQAAGESEPEQVEPEQVSACARLAMGDTSLARWLIGEEGQAVRQGAEAFIRGALAGQTSERQWSTLLEVARAGGLRAGEALQQRWEQEQELWDPKERRRRAREATDAQRRAERRQRTRTLDLALRLVEAWLRDLLCLALDAPDAVFAVDRLTELAADGANPKCTPERLREGVATVAQWRLRLAVNVAEELALEALAYRLQDLLGV